MRLSGPVDFWRKKIQNLEQSFKDFEIALTKTWKQFISKRRTLLNLYRLRRSKDAQREIRGGIFHE